MSSRHHRLPSPALVVASLALVAALSGTAFAAGIVAEARHARRADVATRALDAARLQGRSATEIAAAGARAGAQIPGPADSVASLVSLQSATGAPIAGGASATFSIGCDGGRRAISAGFAADVAGSVVETQAAPAGATTWSLQLRNLDAATPHTVTLYAVCLR